MTGRRFNYTGRRRITRDRVHLVVLPGEDSPELTARVDVDGLDFDPSDRVIAEVYLQSVLERVELGTVGSPRAAVAVPLRRFDDIEGLRCRIKVIVTSGLDAGQIRGIADKLTPEGPEDRPSGRPLLPFVSDPGLGQRPWRLDTSEDTPMVRINPMDTRWRSIAYDSMFTSLVLPAILEDVARWVATHRLGDEDEGPIADWTAFFIGLGADVDALVMTTPEEDREIIVEDVVRRFCERHRSTDVLVHRMTGAEP